jgi:uncharacterized membrane protein YhhN
MTTGSAFFSTTILVVVLLLLERWPRAPRALYGFVKLWASSTFVAYGIYATLKDNVFDRADAALLGALCLSLLGDALLVPRGSKGLFLGGLLSFLLGHSAFVGAFVLRGVDPLAFCGAGVVFLVVGVGVMRWLRPHLRGTMAVAVPVYVIVIGAMVATAVACVVAADNNHRAAPTALLIAGTCCFWVSDLAVARERFVAAGYVNRVVGVPLYFLAQLLIVRGWMR